MNWMFFLSRLSPIQLSGGEGVFIADGIAVMSDNVNGTIHSQGGGNILQINGSVTGVYGAISMGLPQQIEDHGDVLKINATGQIYSLGRYAAVSVTGWDQHVTNAGFISGIGDGITFSSNSGSGVNFLNNSGTIEADYAVARDLTSTEELVFINTGTVLGNTASYLGASNAGSDVIINSGSMHGSMYLYYGDDSYDGRLGHIYGAIDGGFGNDKIYGGSETNEFMGDAGNDLLKGGGGNDHLTGGVGADYLYGEAGSDYFVFTEVADSTQSASGQDTIADFSHAQKDKIDLSLIDAKAGTALNDAFTFIGSAKFTGAKGQLHYTSTTTDTYVSGDTNGDKLADFMIHIVGHHSMVAADFLL